MPEPFLYQDGELHCDGVALREIAEAVGTPAYVYSCRHIVSRFLEFDRALMGGPHLVCYAVKANSNLEILRLLARRNAGFDVVSGGELFRVLQAGGKAQRTVYSGVGKTAAEMDYALRAAILLFNCESEDELSLLSQRAVRLRRRARVALRVNPHVSAATHPYIATGLDEHKFGIEMAVAERLYREAQRWPGIRLVGLSCHIGSQIADLSAFGEAVGKLAEMAQRLRRENLPVEYLDAGGGLAVAYQPDDTPPSIADYGKQLRRSVRGLPVKLLVEPGRAVVAEAGVLLTSVLYTKAGSRKRFVVVDAAMNDLIRPSLYGAYHEIRPVVRTDQHESVADLVGPVCETGDFLARGRPLPAVEPGDLLAISTAGAYGFVLSSNYNSRMRPAEVLVEGRRWRIIRRRETLRDMVRGELRL
ncbi:MAG: diaminopimelate decarboxylase [Acidobacteria bacterium RIFCSPLOWO2_02_FULL_59_13]|nr:MAG: diaminopimelate decarboxylase [Acidobacteria bacterium RIFCSPLOWO2_02_FULL_59_13]